MLSQSLHTFDNNYRVLVIAALAAILVLFLRLDSVDLFRFITNSLWAEDGVVFWNQALEFGIGSIWVEYAGYLHLYPRLVALLAAQLDLAYAPWVFMAGFFLAVWAMMFVVFRGMHEMKVHPLLIFLGALLLALQPNNGDIFFTLTNSQWFLAVALCVLVSVPRLYTQVLPFVVVGALISMTGPFSVLLLPVMCIRLLLDRNIRSNYAFPSAMLVCVVIQAAFIASSGRGGEMLNTNWREWLVMAYDTFTFGSEGTITLVLAAGFWVCLLSALVSTVTMRHTKTGATTCLITTLMLLAAGLFMFVGSLWGFKHAPGALHPVSGNARYFFSPYAMLVLSLLVMSRFTPKICIAGLVLFAIICVTQFRTVERPDLQFLSFTAFGNIERDLIIPIAPNTEEFPGWHVLSASPAPLGSDYLRHTFVGNEIDQFRKSGGAELQIDLQRLCSSSEHFALSITAFNTRPITMRLTWGDDRSLSRFYPAGEVKMQFALANDGVSGPVVLNTQVAINEQTIQQLDVYCIGVDSLKRQSYE